VFHRLHRILILQLGNHQPEKILLAHLLFAWCVRGALPLQPADHVHCTHACRLLNHLPSCSVRNSSCLDVLSTSTLFWNEREAEIMLVISSATLTLLLKM